MKWKKKYIKNSIIGKKKHLDVNFLNIYFQKYKLSLFKKEVILKNKYKIHRRLDFFRKKKKKNDNFISEVIYTDIYFQFIKFFNNVLIFNTI